MRPSCKIAVLIAIDFIALPICFMIALFLLGGLSSKGARIGIFSYVLVSLVTILSFYTVGLYRVVIRYIDYRLVSTAAAGLVLAVFFTHLGFLAFRRISIPGSGLVIYSLIAFSHVITSRFIGRAVLRAYYDRGAHGRFPRVAIYGAGEAGAKLAVAMRSSGEYRPVCFFDDKQSMNNRNVAGLDVFHITRLMDIVRGRRVSLIVIAAPSATPLQRKEMICRVQKTGIPLKVLGTLLELEDEHISTRSMRKIRIEDLLGRDPIAPDMRLLTACTSGKTILVTGAGGSIGSELCRQIVALKPGALHLLDHSEHALYLISKELSENYPDVVLKLHLGSACRKAVVERIFMEFRIDTIYHAAAYKHVPLVEDNVAEGLLNNVYGAKCIAQAAEKFHAENCVLVSSDKAVRPTSVMGASKRIAELIFQAAADRSSTRTKFCMVRFGNVLGSSGSVIPLFQQQLERGGPLTVTHREMTRYFMTIQEASQLVIQAGAMAKGGEVFVMDMGQPVKILEVARSMIALAGLVEKNEETPAGDIEIQFTGLRRGEKLYEELFTASNTVVASAHPRINTTTDYMVEPLLLDQMLESLLGACVSNDMDKAKNLLHRLVKGYASTCIAKDDEPRQVFVQMQRATQAVEVSALRTAR